MGKLGKLILITGGNASGKSTLAYLLYLMASMTAVLDRGENFETLEKKIEEILKDQICLLYDICPPYRKYSLESLFYYDESQSKRTEIIEVELRAGVEKFEDIALTLQNLNNDIKVTRVVPPDLNQRTSEFWDYAIAKIGIYPYYKEKLHADDFGLVTSEGFIVMKEEEEIPFGTDNSDRDEEKK